MASDLPEVTEEMLDDIEHAASHSIAVDLTVSAHSEWFTDGLFEALSTQGYLATRKQLEAWAAFIYMCSPQKAKTLALEVRRLRERVKELEEALASTDLDAMRKRVLEHEF